MTNLKRWLSHNLALKIIAISLTLLLWSYVYFVYGIRVHRKVTLQVNYINTSDQYLLHASDHFIEVTFSAPANSIDQSEKNIRAVIDLAGYSSGSFKRKPVLTYPKGVTVENILPSTIEVSLEQMISKEIRVRPQINGEVTRGNVMGSIELNPDHITITGPESQLNRIADAIVPIDISNANADIFSSIEVLLLDQDQNLVDNLDINQRIIKVYVPIISSNVSKIVPIIPLFAGMPLHRIKSVQIHPPLVTLRGNGSVLEEILSIHTEEISINGLASSTTFKVVLQTIAEVSFEPPDQLYEITIQLEEDIEVTFNHEQINLQIINLSAQFEVDLLENKLQLRLYGPRSILEKLLNPRAVIDLSELGPGEHLVNVKIMDLSPEILAHIYPQKILVKVTEKKS
jgi:YbbR domain-containing protein